MAEYIEREQLLNRERFNRVVLGVTQTAEDVLMMIQTAPAADVEPVRHGQWYFADDGYCRCSECHNRAPACVYEEALESTMTPFCPYCGVKMDLGADGHE